MRIYILFLFGFAAMPSLGQRDSISLKIITTDVEKFWSAFDVFDNDTTANPFIDYLRNGSEVIQVLRTYALSDSAKFRSLIQKNLSYYRQVRPHAYAALNHQDKINKYFHAFKKLYPEAEMPDINLVVGAMNIGGTSNASGVVIGTEMFGDTTAINSYGHHAASTEILGEVIFKCVLFYNQKPAHTGYTVQRESIIHGSADFIATLVSPDLMESIRSKENFAYGERYEELIVREFLLHRYDSDMGNWLYDTNPEDGRPGNMGSWIGYKICEAYYNNHPNKIKAIDDILKINDFDRFLELSGYLEPFLDQN